MFFEFRIPLVAIIRGVAPSLSKLGLRRSRMPLAVCSRAIPQRWDFENP